MKLKLDDDGHVVLSDGKPVYIYEDNRESPFDADATVRKINNLTEEKDRHWQKAKDLAEKLTEFDGIDPIKAREAMEVLKNLDAKKLVDAGSIDTLKRQMGESFEHEKKSLITNFEKEKNTLSTQNKILQDTVYNLMVSSQFAKSSFFSGENPKSVLPPDIASEYFGKYFKIEGEGQDAKVVGYFNGEKILSREKHGEIAGFEEALGVIIDTHPMKDRILKSAQAQGSSSAGNTQTTGSTRTIKRGDREAFGKNLEDIAKGKVKVV